MKRIQLLSGTAATVVFIICIVTFGSSNPEFHFLNSYVSELGAQGAPNATLFNLFGFVLSGLLLFHFGWYYGALLKDRLLSILLGFFGLAFAFTAIPIDSLNQDTPYSKIHVLAICLALAAWLFGLARITSMNNLNSSVKKRANVSAILMVLIIAGGATNLWPMPITHRLVFGVVFGWTLLSSLTHKF